MAGKEFAIVASRGNVAMRGIGLLLVFLLISGCAVSDNPLYNTEDLIHEGIALGRWSDGGNDIYTVESPGDREFTLRSLSKASSKAEMPRSFDLHFLKLGDHYFCDILAQDGRHCFFRVAVLGDNAYLRTIDTGWLKEYFEKHPHVLLHEAENPEHITAATDDLQQFVLAHILSPEAFGGEPGILMKLNGQAVVHAQGITSEKYRTFNYWYELRMTLYGQRSDDSGGLSVHGRLNHLADEISQLPTLGVAKEAADCGIELAALLEQLAQATADMDNKTKAILEGEPESQFTSALRNIERPPALVQECLSWLQQMRIARMKLTQEYGLQFPLIE